MEAPPSTARGAGSDSSCTSGRQNRQLLKEEGPWGHHFIYSAPQWQLGKMAQNKVVTGRAEGWEQGEPRDNGGPA